jgi:hypothetical protein
VGNSTSFSAEEQVAIAEQQCRGKLWITRQNRVPMNSISGVTGNFAARKFCRSDKNFYRLLQNLLALSGNSVAQGSEADSWL